MYTICKVSGQICRKHDVILQIFFSFHAIKIGTFTEILKLTNKFQDCAMRNRMQFVRIACS